MRKLRKKLPVIIHRIVLIFYILGAALPIYWMLNTSFKTQGEIYSKVPTIFPKNFIIDNYIKVLSDEKFLISVKNSLVTALVVVVIGIMIAFPVAYSLTRKQFLGRRTYSKVILFSYLLPVSLMYLPMYMVVSKLGLVNNTAALYLVYPSFVLPYCAWILMPHVGAVPTSIEEAGLIDGCTQFGVMYRIVFRLAVPGIVSTAIFAFANCWGEYMYALVMLTSSEHITVPIYLNNLIIGDMFPWGEIMAGGVMACVPVFLLYMFSSGFLSGDRTAGGVKG